MLPSLNKRNNSNNNNNKKIVLHTDPQEDSTIDEDNSESNDNARDNTRSLLSEKNNKEGSARVDFEKKDIEYKREIKTFGGPPNPDLNDPDIPAGELSGLSGGLKPVGGVKRIDKDVIGGGESDLKNKLREITRTVPVNPDYKVDNPPGGFGTGDNKKSLGLPPKVSLSSTTGSGVELNTSLTTTEDEEEAVIDTRDTLLKTIGLSKTRPEILGMHEFVPVTSNELNESVSQVDLGVESKNYTRITGAGRLIELHRQIRSYTIDTADVVMKELYPFLNNLGFQTLLKNIVNAKLEDSIPEDLNLQSVDYLKTTLGNLIVRIKNITGITEEFRSIIDNNIDKKVFKGIVEYRVLEKILNELLNYTDKLSLLYNDFIDYWGIDKFAGIKPFDTEYISNSYISDNFKEISLLTSLGGTYDYNLYEKVTGISRKTISIGKITDMKVYSQLIASLVSLMNYTDSTYYLEDFKTSDVKFMPDDKKIHYGLVGDLGGILNKIDRMQIKSYSFVGDSSFKKTEDFSTTTLNSNSDLRVNFQTISPDTGDNNLFRLIKGIINKSGQEQSEFESLKELFAYSSQQYVEDHIHSISNVLNDNNIKKETISYILNDNYANLRSKTFVNNFEVLSLNSEFLFKLFFNKNTGNKTLYSLESVKTSGLEANQIGSSYYTYKANELGDIQEFKDLVDTYYHESNDLLEKVLTFFPDNEIISAINPTESQEILAPIGINNSFNFLETIFSELAEELESIYTTSDNSFKRRQILLLMVLESAKTDKEKNYLLNSSFLGVLGSDGNEVGEVDVTTQQHYYEIKESSWRSNAKILADLLLQNLVNRNMRLIFRNHVKEKIENESKTLTGLANLMDAINDLFSPETSSNAPVFGYDPAPANSQGYDVVTNFNEEYFIENFRRAYANEDYEVNKTDLSNPDLNRSYSQSIGLQRLFPNSLEKFIKGVTIGLSGKKDISTLDGRSISNRYASRHYIFFMFVRKLILNNINIYRQNNNVANIEEINGTSKVVIDGLKGIVNGIRAGIKEAKGQNYSIPNSEILDTEKEESSFYNVKSITSDVLGKVNSRQRMIKEHLGMISGHASSFKEIHDKLDTISGISNSKYFTLIKKTLKSPVFGGNLLVDTSNNANRSYINGLRNSINNIFNVKPGTFIPRDLEVSLVKSKLMYKFFSLPDFGFLEEEKRGSKTILNVGITSGLIQALREEAIETFGDDFDTVTLKDKIVISVRKIDTLNPDLTLMPKNFVFDMNMFVNDYNNQGLTNHLTNYEDVSSLNKILENVETETAVYFDTNNSYTRISEVGYDTSDAMSKDIILNHFLDYLLKYYQKMTTGLDFDESSFLLKLSPMKYRRVYNGPMTGEDLPNDFSLLLERLRLAYPSVFENRQLQSEVERMVNVLKQSFPFSNTRRFEKTVRPRSFDRVFSVIVNEKDFVPHKRKSEEYDIFFPNSPNFTGNSLLDIEDVYNVRNTNNTEELRKYFKGTKNNHPEVYNYTVSIGFLVERSSLNSQNSNDNENEGNNLEPTLVVGLIWC